MSITVDIHVYRPSERRNKRTLAASGAAPGESARVSGLLRQNRQTDRQTDRHQTDDWNPALRDTSTIYGEKDLLDECVLCLG